MARDNHGNNIGKLAFAGSHGRCIKRMKRKAAEKTANKPRQPTRQNDRPGTAGFSAFFRLWRPLFRDFVGHERKAPDNVDKLVQRGQGVLTGWNLWDPAECRRTEVQVDSTRWVVSGVLQDGPIPAHGRRPNNQMITKVRGGLLEFYAGFESRRLLQLFRQPIGLNILNAQRPRLPSYFP